MWTTVPPNLLSLLTLPLLFTLPRSSRFNGALPLHCFSTFLSLFPFFLLLMLAAFLLRSPSSPGYKNLRTGVWMNMQCINIVNVCSESSIKVTKTLVRYNEAGCFLYWNDEILQAKMGFWILSAMGCHQNPVERSPNTFNSSHLSHRKLLSWLGIQSYHPHFVFPWGMKWRGSWEGEMVREPTSKSDREQDSVDADDLPEMLGKPFK